MAVQGGITLPVGLDLKNVDGDVKKLAQRFKEVTQQIDIQSKKVDELKAHLDSLENGGITATSREIQKMQSEFDKTTASIEKTKAEINAIGGQLTAVYDNAFKDPVTHQPVFTESEQAQIDAMNAKLDQLEAKLEADKQKAAEMGEALKTATGAATQAEIEKTKQKLAQAETKLESLQVKAEDTGNKLKKSMDNASNSTSSLAVGMDKFNNKLLGMAKRVFIFSMLTKALRGVREQITNVIMSDSGLQTSLYRLQAAFWTAFAPIANYIIPAITKLINWVTAAATAIGQLIAALTGKSYKAMIAQGKALQQRAAAYGASAKGAKKDTKATKDSTKATEKQLAAFDELQILQENKDKDSSGGSGGNDSGTGGGLANAFNDVLTPMEQLEGKFTAIATVVGSIGAGLAAWKISEFIAALYQGGEAAEALKSKINGIVGAIMIVAGTILTAEGYSDAWVNGIDWKNLAETIGGLALVIGGIALAISPAAAAFAAIGAGVALLVLGVRDMIAQGPTFQNILTVIIGLLGIFGATLYLATLPVALVVTAIAALVAAFVYLWNTNEEFKQFWIDLWNNIKTAVSEAWENTIKPAMQALGDFFVTLWNDYIVPFWNEWLKPMLTELGQFITDVYNNHILPVLQWIGSKLSELWDNAIKPFWEEHLKPAIEEIWSKIEDLWNNVISPTLEFIGNKVNDLWDSFLKPFIDKYLIPLFINVFKAQFESAKDTFQTVFKTLGDTIDNFKTILGGVIDFITGTFNGDWGKAWEGIKGVFAGIANEIITIFESMINFIVNGLNTFLRGINSTVEVIGTVIGQDWDLNMHVNTVKLPRIAVPKGADGMVIPPNREFLAIFGDQKRGTNIEAPLDTIKQAVAEVLQSGGYQPSGNQTIILELDGREVGRTFGKAITQEANRVGSSFVKTKLVF